MNFRDEKTTIGMVVSALPEATAVFKKYNIDFCCGGYRPLIEVIKQQNADAEQVYKELEQAQNQRAEIYQDLDFASMKASVLGTYIEDKHHAYLRKALPETAQLLTTILRVHGKNHKELFEIYKLFGGLKSELEQHLLKEETMLFPAFEGEEENKDEIAKLAIEIINEHETAGESLVKLRELTNNYQLPKDACETYEKAYMLLEQLEEDLHQHIHLENNIMFKSYDIR